MAKNTAVFGIYSDYETLEAAADGLKNAGFRNTDVSLLCSENIGSKDFTHVKATKAPEGVAAGAVSGGAIGGAIGWLLGIGAITLPGAAPLMVAGPIVAALAGVGTGAAVGGVAGALVGLGIPEYEAKRYEGRVRRGGILLSVHCDDSQWARKAKQVLRSTGADDIAATGEAEADFAASDKPMPRKAA
jgi:hypothetical protein